MIHTVRAIADFRTTYQQIDGFGFSQAFQRAALLRGDCGLSGAKRTEVLDLLLSPDRGAGLSILRLGIGSSDCDAGDRMKSIQPVSPGSPSAEPRYLWNGDDGGQVWLAREAQRYGIKRFYAVAWSAPGYMKTTGTDSDGGRLLGLPGTEQFLEDWRSAYSNYLLQYVKFYRQEGIEITDIAFMNEPELSHYYATMEFSIEQMIDMVKVIGPAIAASGLHLNLICCEACRRELQVKYTKVIESDSDAAQWINAYSFHGYHPAEDPYLDSKLPTDKPAWMSEWVPDLNGPDWVEKWDGSPASGVQVACDIHRALTLSHVSAYIYWFGASIGASRSLIQLDGPNYRVSKRLWALASYSRFIRPGAIRVAASAADGDVLISAFRNPDESQVVVLLNTSQSQLCLEVTMEGMFNYGSRCTTYLTDSEHSMEPGQHSDMRDALLRVQQPPRSLISIVVSHSEP